MKHFLKKIVPFLSFLIILSACQNQIFPFDYGNNDIQEDQKMCLVDTDCVPEPNCHPRNCINNEFYDESNEPDFCTELFDSQAAYDEEDCICENQKCINKNLEKVLIKAEFSNKIVYDQDSSKNIESFQNDCNERGGEFNECGTPCAPDADICATVCAYTCTLKSSQPEEGKKEYQGFNNTDLPLKVATGFSIETFAENLEGARVMAGPDALGNLWVSRTSENVISLLEISDGKVSNVSDVFTDLNKPHGIVLDPRDRTILYIAETDKVSRVELYTEGEMEKLVDLPPDGRHYTRSLKFGSDGRLYISIGSSCDVCYEDDERRAAIYVMNEDGSDFQSFATGLRNSVFMSVDPIFGELWATEMGRDNLGDNLPPDEINIIKEGDYGWPICYGKNIHDDDFDTSQYVRNPCEDKIESKVNLQAHSAPLGLDFVPEEGWPEDYWLDLIVAYHGSWNRSKPTGYKLVHIKLDDQGNLVKPPEDFIFGWLSGEGENFGRPVDILILNGGVAYVSDDKLGVIYKITYINQDFNNNNQNSENNNQESKDENENSTDSVSRQIFNNDEKGLSGEIEITDDNQININGMAVGNWFFEGTFTIRLLNSDDEELASSNAEAEGNWMTESQVEFTASIQFSEPETDSGKLIFEKANPSGLSQNADSLEVDIDFE